MNRAAAWGMKGQGMLAQVTHTARTHRSARNYAAGHGAERMVERRYARLGFRCLERRWRGPGGEIDLIFQDQSGIVCVEVKASATHERARSRVSRRQAQRIMASATAYLGRRPMGQLTPLRIDVATVDQQGDIDVIENAFFGF